jgi:hypothetical protein
MVSKMVKSRQISYARANTVRGVTGSQFVDVPINALDARALIERELGDWKLAALLPDFGQCYETSYDVLRLYRRDDSMDCPDFSLIYVTPALEAFKRHIEHEFA